jgi:hypothetical protein
MNSASTVKGVSGLFARIRWEAVVVAGLLLPILHFFHESSVSRVSAPWSTSGVHLAAAAIGLVGLCSAMASPATRPSSRTVTFQPPTVPLAAERSLESACAELAIQWKQDVGDTLIVQPASPFVVVTDLDAAALSPVLSGTIQPTCAALQLAYFDTPPAQPIVLLLLSEPDLYRSWTRKLARQKTAEYAGLYLRDERIAVLDLSTGEGTLAHELTHALAHADCPELPEWFDEGLASLHEESEFSPDGRELIGSDNWRRPILLDAFRAGTVPPIAEWLTQPFARSERGPTDYAIARYLCCYLQSQGRLHHFYRKVKAFAGEDPHGVRALRAVIGDTRWQRLDDDFRRWLEAE